MFGIFGGGGGRRAARRRVEIELALLVLVAIIGLNQWQVTRRFLRKLDLWTLDMRFELRGRQPPPPDVLIVAIDDESLLRMAPRWGMFPWSRRAYAEFLGKLAAAPPKAVFFDIIMTERHQADPQGDALLAEGARKAGHVFVPLLNPSELHGVRASDEYKERFQYPLDLSRVYHSTLEGVVTPLRALSKVVCGAGYVLVPPDEDGKFRHANLLSAMSGGTPTYALVGLDIARHVLDVPRKDLAYDEGGEVRIGQKMRVPVSNSRTTPIAMLADFYGKEKTIPTVSFADVLEGELPAETWKDKVVMVGQTASGTTDIRANPFSGVFPGVEMKATVVANLLDGKFLQETPPVIGALLICLLGVFMALVLPTLSPKQGAGLTVGLFGAYALFGYYLFVRNSMVIDMASQGLTIVLCFAAIYVYRLATEEKEKKYVRDTFAKYVTKQVADELLRDPDKVALGGERRDMSVLFSDIRGFTTMSEKLDAHEVVVILNEYFTMMTEIVFDNEGTIDKFIGDAIMVLFNAPAGQEDHAERAVRTALQMRRALEKLKERWTAEGHADRAEFAIGIGINTGEMVVGNIGSEKYKNYTVIGDNVNLASRLESLNKNYGTDIIVSEETYRRVERLFSVEPLGTETVKGKEKPVSIYHVTGVK